MIVEEIKIPQPSLLMHDYLEHFEKVRSFYEYHPFETKSWYDRKEWLSQNPIKHREHLTRGLLAFNKDIGNHPHALQNIEYLKQQDTYVVIGGQQAGVMTGPLYSIYKAITLIQLARNKEKELNCRVVPVFWIAGEDHDFDEVNHVYSLNVTQDQVTKLALKPESDCKYSVSHQPVGCAQLVRFVKQFVDMQPDGVGKKEIQKKLLIIADESTTLVQFFAKTMAWLFGEHGLIMVDSALPFVRQLEKSVFQEVIQKNKKLSSLVHQKSVQLEEAGYHSQVEVEENQAHFFIYHNGERVLIKREDQLFVSKDGILRFTEGQLLEKLEQNPELFSANVVTRPLMQEYLFPTLAFVGGPGEIAYWGLYRDIFQEMNLRMPIIVPRTSITLLEPSVAKWMESYHIKIEDVFEGLEKRKQDWLKTRDDFHLPELFKRVREEIAGTYAPLKQELSQIEKGLEYLTEKNLKEVLEQVAYLERKSNKAFERKYQNHLKRIENVEISVRPMNKPQERVYNIFTFLNKNGLDFINRLVDQELSMNGDHKLIYL